MPLLFCIGRMKLFPFVYIQYTINIPACQYRNYDLSLYFNFLPTQIQILHTLSHLSTQKSCTRIRIHPFLYSLDIMPATGIEPVCEYKSRRILSPVRLPVPPHRHGARQSRRIVNTYDFLWRSLSVSNAVTVM